MKEFFRKTKAHPLVLLFFCFLALYSVGDCFAREKKRDEYENRQLAQFPDFSWSSLAANEWTVKYEEYVQDQFLLRHEWIVLKSVAESVLLRTENNGVVYGADDYQFAKFMALPAGTDTSTTQLAQNIGFVQRFIGRHPGKVSVMIVPSAANILADKLPAGVPLLDENPYLDALPAQLEGANVLDIRPAFRQNSAAQQLYYRTDHHWTTDGAWLAYRTVAPALGLGAFDTAQHTAVDSPGFYGTNFNKSLKYDTVPDTLRYYPLDLPLTVKQFALDGSEYAAESGPLYDLDKLATRDQYAMFLRGNNGYSTIPGTGPAERRILVLKDSYANCFVPFLTADYGQVDVVDLRTWKYNVENLINMFDYDDILLLYSFQNFASETSVFYLNAMVSE